MTNWCMVSLFRYLLVHLLNILFLKQTIKIFLFLKRKKNHLRIFSIKNITVFKMSQRMFPTLWSFMECDVSPNAHLRSSSSWEDYSPGSNYFSLCCSQVWLDCTHIIFKSKRDTTLIPWMQLVFLKFMNV